VEVAEGSRVPWHILVVDDKEGVAEETAELLNRTLNADSSTDRVLAEPEHSFDGALKTLGRGGIDLLVLDVIQQGEAAPGTGGELRGIDVFQQVRSTRFLPIVFLTALPNEVRPYENPPFVQVVSKQAHDFNMELAQCVSKCLDSPFPLLSRELQNHINRISRDFMIEFVEGNWNELSESEGDIAHLLMRRLGVSFDNGGDIFKEGSVNSLPSSGTVPSIRYYIVPPPDEYRMGDILKLQVPTGNDGECVIRWYIIMTPSCDFANNKVDSVVVVECIAIEEFEEYQKWTQSNSNETRKKLVRLLRSNPTTGQRDRYYYLPKAWKLPDLIADFQKILHIPYEDLSRYDKQASMDSPYAESLSNQFNSYMGRIGTPDLDIELAINQMDP
jgi:CheY-like chemotaxis protein